MTTQYNTKGISREVHNYHTWS